MYVWHRQNKMAEHGGRRGSVTSRKRKAEGRMREKTKQIKLTSHTTGPDCKCARLKCFQAVDEENRAELIRYFNSLPNKEAQDSYLADLITVAEVKRRRPRSDKPKSNNKNSYTYIIKVKRGDQNFFAEVCFLAFQSFFGIGKGRLETIKKSLATTGSPPKDRRGKHSNRPHKMTANLRQKVRDHISLNRGRQSHYSQQKTTQLCQPKKLNVRKMFNLFKVQHPDEKLSYESYRTIFNTDFKEDLATRGVTSALRHPRKLRKS